MKLILEKEVQSVLNAWYLYLYFACLGACLFVSNKREQKFCGASNDPWKGLCMIQILKISLQQNSISIQF